MALKFIAKSIIRTFPSFQKWHYNFAGFNQYGLHQDDLYWEDEIVTEALRRLNIDAPHIIEERNFRFIRASQLDCQKKVLPKEQWVKYEEDMNYLTPYVEEVKREQREREQWDAEYSIVYTLNKISVVILLFQMWWFFINYAGYIVDSSVSINYFIFLIYISFICITMLYKISHLSHNAVFRSKSYQLKEINTLQLTLKI